MTSYGLCKVNLPSRLEKIVYFSWASFCLTNLTSGANWMTPLENHFTTGIDVNLKHEVKSFVYKLLTATFRIE